MAGALFVTSAVSSDGIDLRAGRYGDLASVVRQATDEVDTLSNERNQLAEEIEELTERLSGTAAAAVQEEVDDLEVLAGLTALRGLTVELDDSPSDTITSSGLDPKWLVVHQQDIQAVVNALWLGGAEGMTIRGQRVVSTTGIKCVGNTVVLHDIPYAPPYVITAVGDPASMLAEINGSPYLDIYRELVEAYGLGWDVLVHDDVELPAFDGIPDLQHARPAGPDSTNSDDAS